MKFTQQQVEAFCEASHDRNPVHTDLDYARRTPFGRPVVYGVLGVIAALAAWSDGKPFRLRRICAVFRKPLFLGEDYTFDAQEKRGRIYARIGRGSVEYCQLQFEPADRQEAAPGPLVTFTPRAQPVAVWEDGDCAAQTSYLPDQNAASRLLSTVGMSADQIPEGQLSALLWSSYWVGMVMPGRQALFAELEFVFSAAQSTPGLELTLDAPSLDERFNRLSMGGSGSDIVRFDISAFVRPRAVEFNMDHLRAWGGDLKPLAGQRVLITGAGRGFGASLAAIAGLRGAQVLLNYREHSHIPEGLRAAGVDVVELPGDLRNPAECRRMVAQIAKIGGAIDLIVNSAFPPIHNHDFFEQTPDEWLSFIDETMRVAVHCFHHFLPFLADEGRFVQISTQFVAKPEKGFSHYVASKSAQEALARSLALEMRKRRFVIARLPRMRTDQTNIPYDLHPPVDAGKVAARLLKSLEPGKNDALLTELDLTFS